MIHRLYALIVLTSRRLDSANDYTSQLRTDALANGRTQGFAAAATTRW